jgi:hypothetical protein
MERIPMHHAVAVAADLLDRVEREGAAFAITRGDAVIAELRPRPLRDRARPEAPDPAAWSGSGVARDRGSRARRVVRGLSPRRDA